MIRVKKILYGTDFSAYSNQAYFHALALAESHGASLTIVHVYTPAYAAVAEGAGVMPLVVDNPAADRDYWREQLEQIRPLNEKLIVHHALLDGKPAEELIQFAVEEAIDLIVIGTHGRTGLERLLMGSVAEKVLRGAPCSVLVVKMPRPVQASQETETVVVAPA